jgi:hypothetical protein
VQIRPKMRKRILAWTVHSPAEPGWLDLEGTALIEITSEDIAFPIESALLQRETEAGAPPSRVQRIRLIFDQPQSIRQLSLLFVEKETQRAQEFTLRSSPDRGNSFQEIIRQQRNFSSTHSTREPENYAVALSNVTLLDLTIDPR